MGWGPKAGDGGSGTRGRVGPSVCSEHTWMHLVLHAVHMCDVHTKQAGGHLQPYIPCEDPTITKHQDGNPCGHWVRRSPSYRAVGLQRCLSPSPTEVTGEAWRLCKEGELSSREVFFATKVKICIALGDTGDVGSCDGGRTGPLCPGITHQQGSGVGAGVQTASLWCDCIANQLEVCSCGHLAGLCSQWCFCASRQWSSRLGRSPWHRAQSSFEPQPLPGDNGMIQEHKGPRHGGDIGKGEVGGDSGSMGVTGALGSPICVRQQVVVLRDPTQNPDNVLRASRSREKSYVFDAAFDSTSTQVGLWDGQGMGMWGWEHGVGQPTGMGALGCALGPFTLPQETVYRATTQGFIASVISGCDATVFAYGPTGKGLRDGPHMVGAAERVPAPDEPSSLPQAAGRPTLCSAPTASLASVPAPWVTSSMPSRSAAVMQSMRSPCPT